MTLFDPIRKPKLLDLFCGEGGASMGYHLAGFDVTGVDAKAMPRYPFAFVKANVMGLDPNWLAQFDVIAASPPCKVHTAMKAFSGAHHLDLIPQTRAMLKASGKFYVIENVMGAPLIDPIMLCGSAFGMHVERHRLFESNVRLTSPGCHHAAQHANSPGYPYADYHSGIKVMKTSPVVSVFGRGRGFGPGETDLWRRVMQMSWASKDGLREAIPPPYTKFIGEQIIKKCTG